MGGRGVGVGGKECNSTTNLCTCWIHHRRQGLSYLIASSSSYFRLFLHQLSSPCLNLVRGGGGGGVCRGEGVARGFEGFLRVVQIAIWIGGFSWDFFLLHVCFLLSALFVFLLLTVISSRRYVPFFSSIVPI